MDSTSVQTRKVRVVFDIGVIRVPEGFIQFITVVVRNQINDDVTPTNIVVGSDFNPNWDDPSDQLMEFDETVLLWVNGIYNVARDLNRIGFSLVFEDGGDLATEEIIFDLD